MKRKALVYVLLGQSNAVGHALPMAEEDKITRPMRHVFGLSRGENQVLTPSKLVFSGYTSAGMNLGETQDDTYSLANCLASLWEDEAAKNPALPDLYVVHVAIGAEGLSEGYMWNPSYPETMLPGTLKEVKISLFPFTARVLSLLGPTFEALGVDFEVLGVHWRGGENDMGRYEPAVTVSTLRPLYEQLFSMLRASLGEGVPIRLYEILFSENKYLKKPSGNNDRTRANVAAVNALFRDFAAADPRISVFAPSSLALYDSENPATFGIFKESDGTHYTASANREIARRILRETIR